MRIPARLDREIQALRSADWSPEELATKVPTSQVVDAGLVKSTVLLEGYNSPMEETVTALLEGLRATEDEARVRGLDFVPKAIYVSDTNVVADTPNQTDSPRQPFSHRKAPPILIWRYLTEECGVDPAQIAVYANLKVDKDYPLPEDFVLYSGADQDFADFTVGNYQHIIFNLRLQEGWDDPSVYFAYIDKSMGSRAQVTQVIGRVLRQPNATHYSELLDTAHFYVRVDKNEVFSNVVAEVEKELGGEPGGIRIAVSSPGKPHMDVYHPKVDITVPETGIDSTRAMHEVQGLLEAFPDFRADHTNTRGTGSRRIVQQKVGATANTEDAWETFEQSSTASARWVFHREVQRQFSSALGVVNLANPKLDATIGIGSPAYATVCRLAEDVVDTFIENVRLNQRRLNPYKVGALLARPDQTTTYDNAVHQGYAGLNGEEARFAQALDDHGLLWARNPDRIGYGIPLITPGPTRNFYPDFLLWTDQRVVCIDTKGSHLIQETAARKLLRVSYPGEGPRLDIQFVSVGRYDAQLERRDSEGYTAWFLSDDGRVSAHHFADLPRLVDYLADDDAHP